MSLKRCQGFTLIETVAAFAILALAAAAIYESFGLTLRRAQRAHDEQVALLTAESLLDRAGVDLRFSEGALQTEGEEGDRRWSITAKLIEPPKGESPYAVIAYEIKVVVAWERDGTRRDISLRKIVLQPPIDRQQA